MDFGNGGFLVDNRHAYVAGGLSAVLFMATTWVVGSLSGAEAVRLLQSTTPTLRFLCSTTGTASATILALMLTMLALSQTHDRTLKHSHYRRVRQIAVFSIVTLASSVFLLMVLFVPLTDSENLPLGWYTALYYLILAASALMGGLLVMVSLMLFQAIEGLVSLIQPEIDSPIVVQETEEST